MLDVQGGSFEQEGNEEGAVIFVIDSISIVSSNSGRERGLVLVRTGAEAGVYVCAVGEEEGDFFG